MALPFYDTFIVQVIEGRNLPALDKSGTSDPYVSLSSSFNKQKFKTKFISKTLNPTWNQTFTFFTSEPEGTITLKAYDHDYLSRDDYMGEVVLHLADYKDGKEHDQWFPLLSEPEGKKSNSSPASLHLKVKFGEPEKGHTNDPKHLMKYHGVTKEKLKEASEKKESKHEDKEKSPKEKKNVKIEDKYTFGKVLGRGGFAVVKKATHNKSGKTFAVKIIAKKKMKKEDMVMLQREIDIMKKLQHPHIIQLVEIFDTSENLYLVLEFASGGELFEGIVSKGHYSEIETATIVRQILEAIKYCHDRGIAHRDLKPENLLLLAPEEGKGDFIKIADFGLSKDFGAEQLQTACGTPDYVAPEIISGDVYDKEVDIWSIGVITYIVLCGFPPFYGNTQKELFDRIMDAEYDFPDPEWSEISDAAKKFISKMLVVDPKKRYTAEEALNDPWLNQEKETAAKLRTKSVVNISKFREYNQKYKENAPAAPVDDDDD